MMSTVFRPRVRTRELYPSPFKKGGLGYGSCELRYGFAADVNAIVPNRGSEPLLMMHYCVCVHFTHFPDALQAESCISHFCSPSVFFRAFASLLSNGVNSCWLDDANEPWFGLK